MAAVIGLNLGNYNSYTSVIEFDDTYRRFSDGSPVTEGMVGPSAFFYSPERGVRTGRSATTSAAMPECNRIRCLQRSIGEPLIIGGKPLVIDGKQWLYDDAIREVVQTALRETCREYAKQRAVSEVPYHVSLAYPARFSPSERERLIQIVNSAKLEDGRHFEVVGTIAEPAAAALEYLARANCCEDTNVLVFDLGGDALDLCLVTCCPKGWRRQDGSVTYYKILADDVLKNTGGQQFSEVVYRLLHAKIDRCLKESGAEITAAIERALRENVEALKCELSDSDLTVYEATIPSLSDERVFFELTREEFENDPQVVEMLARMMEKIRNITQASDLPRPDVIVLAGGSCRMPVIRKALLSALPEFARSISSIRDFRPETAIACGAARYGALSQRQPSPRRPDEEKSGVREPLQDGPDQPQHGQAGADANNHSDELACDLGVCYYRDPDDKTGYVVPFAKRGTKLPFTSRWARGASLVRDKGITYELFRSIAPEPDPQYPERDYRLVTSITFEPGTSMEPGTNSEIRLLLEEDGKVGMEVRKDGKSSITAKHLRLSDIYSESEGRSHG